MRTRPVIVHLSSAHPANDPRIYEKECTTLARAGYDVRLVATGRIQVDTEISITRIPRPRKRLIRMTVGPALGVVRAISMRPNLVHLHDPELAPWILLLRLTGVRVVFDSHEDISAAMLNKTYLSPMLQRLVSYLSQALVRFIDTWSSGIVAATPSIAKRFKNPQLCLVQNFPILQNWQPRTRTPLQQLVYVGALSEARGALRMLDAIDALSLSHPGTRLKIAGRIEHDLLMTMREHPGWTSTDFLGILDRERVTQLLADSTIGLVLFQPDPNHINSQPTKMFEYMAAGLPVVASDFPLWRKMVIEPSAGLVADPCDSSAIVTVISELLNDPATAIEMGRRGRQFAEQAHNWEREGQVLLSFYGESLGLRLPVPAATTKRDIEDSV